MKTKIKVIIYVTLLAFLGLIIIGTIGANSNFENITFNVLSIKNLFLGIMKIAPLVLIISFIIVIVKKQ